MEQTNEAVLRKSKTNKWLLIAFLVSLALLIVTTTLWLVNSNKRSEVNATIENVYQRNFYDLIDNVNNAEVKLGKV